MKKKTKFVSLVHTLIHIMAVRYPQFKIEDIATVIGKAHGIEEADLTKGSMRMSDRALEFIRYQLHMTDVKPFWYTGEQ